MLFFLQVIIVIAVAFISHEHGCISQFVPPYTSIVIPVTKHNTAATSLYSVQIMTSYENQQYLHANFLVDIDAPFTWHDCILQWNIHPGSCPINTLCKFPVSCEEYQCTDTRTTYSYHHQNPSSNCPSVSNSLTLPGWGFCTCPVNVVNPVTKSCTQALLNYDDFTFNTSNGRNVFTGVYGVNPNAACANSSSSFESFPKDVNGVMAFSFSPYALPAYLYQPLKKTLAICLPSSLSSPGVLFFGTGPYYVLNKSDVDVRSYLSYTPLIKHPDYSGYFIGVNSILIRRRSIDLENISIKLSTIERYTTLRTDLYNRLVWAFWMNTIGIPRAIPVAPFGLCFRIFSPRVLSRVPDIDLVLSDGKRWSISVANSMKQVTRDVACLAFVDGGETPVHGVVMGTFQFEDNFVEFDLENLRFGFSSSLLREQTSCQNFNFTLTDSG